MIIRIDPDGGACFLVEAKKPGEDSLRMVHLELLFEKELGDQPGPYERLLGDALAATRASSRARTWSRRPGASSSRSSTTPPIETYEPGGWGPEGPPT